jgi:hypothetical protein
LVEQGTENPRVIGSIPIGGTKQKIPDICLGFFVLLFSFFVNSMYLLNLFAYNHFWCCGISEEEKGGCKKDRCT